MEITKLVEFCFSTLNTYGKNEYDLEKIIGAFDYVLIRYHINDIRYAFGEYLSRQSNMPTPADIVNIIDPPKEWCVEKFKVIRDKMKSENVFVTRAEEKYYKEFLSRELKGHDK